MVRKCRLIINGMFYGDGYTKRMLWTVFLLFVLAIGGILTAAALWQWPFLAAGIICLIIDFFLIRSMELGVYTESGEDEEDEDEEDKEQSLDEEKLKKRDGTRTEKTGKKQSKTSDSNEELAERKDPSKETTKEEKIEAAVEAIEEYNEKDMKKLFYRYKVKKNHRPVLIDSSSKYRIKECPAYVWTHHGQFHMLLLEEKPRKISIPLEAVQKMYYEKMVPANQKKEYDCLVGQSMISLVFNEYRPVYQSAIVNGRTQEVKNLYKMGPDIRFTATSARELMILLQPDFVVEDSVMESDEYNQYFKQIYKLKILLSDGVLNMKDYQSKIRLILQKMAEAPITPAAFRMTLTDMVQQQLISSDYANYYTQQNRQFRERHNHS